MIFSLNTQRVVQPKLMKFGELGEVKWLTCLKHQDKHYQMHAENVRFVHTCLRVCVGTGNLVVCMTETVLSTVAWGCKRKVNQKPNVAADEPNAEDKQNIRAKKWGYMSF